ncbi:MAG: LysM peptidoglycan-binding domain-containing protein [bacterium]
MKLATRIILTASLFCLPIPGAALAGISLVGSSIHESEVRVAETYQGVIAIKNTGSRPAQLKVYQSDHEIFQDHNNDNFSKGTKTERSNANWISFGPIGLVIPPKATAGISYTVTVPETDSLSGAYRSMIVVEELPGDASNASMARKRPLQTALKENRRLGIMIVTHIVNSRNRDLSQKKFGGTVKGRVCDEETKEPLPNILLRVNEAAAVTDRYGNFVFSSLKPGRYFFSVDKASLPLNKVTVQKNPTEVRVTAGEVTWINVGVTSAAALTGQIVVYHFENNDNKALWRPKSEDNFDYVYSRGKGNIANRFLEEEANLVKGDGLARALVQLSNGSEIRRRVSDSSGRFVFKNLPHGRWTLTISEYYLPENHYLEKNVLEIDLTAGVEKEALVKILPKRMTDFQYYTVQKGDWLSKIAKKFYGDVMKYSEIFEANQKIIKNPNLIYPGQRLRIPHASRAGEYYVVEAGDWLSKIAKKLYGDAMKYTEIFEANRKIIKDPNFIFSGQRLQIPPVKQDDEYYAVQRGDWLSKIARKFYGDVQKYTRIFEANREIIHDPDLIYPGERLRIPLSKEHEKQFAVRTSD